jgi:mannose-1-phosphate guanylyltransferase/mannose-6-phosphate isomerase
MIVPVILSGGAGTRLWPISRLRSPKQLASLTGTETLIQATARRISELEDVDNPIVVCNEQHVQEIGEQLAPIGVSPRFIVEPVGRNTAPAAAAAALAAGRAALLLVLPSDHIIADTSSLFRAIDIASGFAASGHLVTFGVVPDRPETGYGYIRKGSEVGLAYHIDRFVEKPDAETAETYLEQGDYLWNSGMFLFRADTYLEALERHAPEMAEALVSTINASAVQENVLRLDPDAFAACPSDSIDYAVMERADNGIVVPLDAGWSDVGSWDALWELSEKDADGNSTSGDVMLEGVKRSIVRGKDRLVVVMGLEDAIVIETDDAVLVATKERAQDVKKIVDRLRAAGRPEV